MQQKKTRVVSVHVGAADEFDKEIRASISLELDGIVGDRHRGFQRKTWRGDKQAEGSLRRNERQWSAVSLEELQEVSNLMGLAHSLSAAELGANLCFDGIRQLSKLPKGTILKFSSGAELVVVEYNPPCHDLGKHLADKYKTSAGQTLSTTAFSQAAQFKRGIVGIVDVPGKISAGDCVDVMTYKSPTWYSAVT